MNTRADADCDYVYKGTLLVSYACLVVLSGEMGVGKSNILQRYQLLFHTS